MSQNWRGCHAGRSLCWQDGASTLHWLPPTRCLDHFDLQTQLAQLEAGKVRQDELLRRLQITLERLQQRLQQYEPEVKHEQPGAADGQAAATAYSVPAAEEKNAGGAEAAKSPGRQAAELKFAGEPTAGRGDVRPPDVPPAARRLVRERAVWLDDHLAVWHKPQCPVWMDEATYVTIPATLTVRELRMDIDTPGCRTEEVVIATTLTDAAVHGKDDLADLYHARWHVEPDIRAVKQYLQMEHLRCRTPFMVEKEIWAHFLGYNLTRKVSCQAALLQEVHPRQVSFTATQQTINATRSQLTKASLAERVRQGGLLLKELGKELVGNRPDRCEPRCVKRRPKPYKLLTEPRAKARARLLDKQQC